MCRALSCADVVDNDARCRHACMLLNRNATFIPSRPMQRSDRTHTVEQVEPRQKPRHVHVVWDALLHAEGDTDSVLQLRREGVRDAEQRLGIFRSIRVDTKHRADDVDPCSSWKVLTLHDHYNLCE